MSLSIPRFWSVPQRVARTLIAATSQYNSRLFISADPIETTEDDDDDNTDIVPHEEEEEDTEDVFSPEVQQDYSHYISDKPQSEYGRRMRVYRPGRSAGTQGVAKVGLWRVEPMNPRNRWGNPLMGWTSTRDPMGFINHGLDRFETREHAIQWCQSNGYEYEVFEPKTPRRKPKNYTSTFGRNGPPQFAEDTSTNTEEDTSTNTEEDK